MFDATREIVYRAFTDPDHLVAWWGPIGNSLPRDEIEFDVRPGHLAHPGEQVGSSRSPSCRPFDKVATINLTGLAAEIL